MSVFTCEVNLLIFIDKKRAVSNAKYFVDLSKYLIWNFFEYFCKMLTFYEGLVPLIIAQRKGITIAINTNNATISAWVAYDVRWLLHVRFWLLVHNGSSWFYLAPCVDYINKIKMYISSTLSSRHSACFLFVMFQFIILLNKSLIFCCLSPTLHPIRKCLLYRWKREKFTCKHKFL